MSGVGAECKVAILALTTSGPRGEIGLRLPGGGTVTAGPLPPRGRGREIAPRIAALLGERGLRPADLAALAVDVGPGSFTGVRVGVATAKALAYALRLPIVPATSLEILAEAAPATETVLALRDAGRETYYYALYGPADAGGERPARRAPARGEADAVRAAAGGAHVVGEQAPDLAARLGLPGEATAQGAQARALLQIAERRLERGGARPAHGVAPLYLQPSAPERRCAGEDA